LDYAVRRAHPPEEKAIIPIRDTVPVRRFPIVGWALVAANAAAFLWLRYLNPDELAIYPLSVVPLRFLLRVAHDPGELVTPFTAMFLHAGWLHLLGNMLYLHIFGDNVEDALGRARFLALYLAAGFVSFVAQALMSPASTVPAIGASGAVAGLLGAYLVLYPRARVVAVIPLLFFFPMVELPAWFFIGGWFVLQFLYGAASIGQASAMSGGTAWWAHVGGFVAGIALLRVLKKP
jgi:membrane associated rhomboid family serine protease